MIRTGLILLALVSALAMEPAAAQTPLPKPQPQPTVQPDQGVPARCARLIKVTDREKCLKSLPH